MLFCIYLTCLRKVELLFWPQRLKCGFAQKDGSCWAMGIAWPGEIAYWRLVLSLSWNVKCLFTLPSDHDCRRCISPFLSLKRTYLCGATAARHCWYGSFKHPTQVRTPRADCLKRLRSANWQLQLHFVKCWVLSCDVTLQVSYFVTWVTLHAAAVHCAQRGEVNALGWFGWKKTQACTRRNFPLMKSLYNNFFRYADFFYTEHLVKQLFFS